MPSLDFKGKQHIYAHHLTVPYRPIEPDEKRSCNPSGTDDNLIIHGDNLHALKALLPRYANRIKCIYIDPPYNIGNEGWVYNDNVNSLLMQKWLTENGPVDNEDLERHDKWLCMMWPRLQLLKELLAEDGVIFISIDDNEQHHLRMLMDEIFGAENFIGSFIWEGTGKNDARFISVGHDYIFVYAKSFEQVKTNTKRWRVTKEGIEDIQKRVEVLKKEHGENYDTISEKLKAWYRSLNKNHKAWKHRHYNWVDKNGVYFAGDISWPGGGGPRYEVLHPFTRKPVKIPASGWRFAQKETLDAAIRAKRIHFGEDENSVPNLKRYLHETKDQILNSIFYQDRRAAHQNLVRILGNSEFKYPKDERIMGRLIEAVTSRHDIILDSFAGSGTTAHAVLTLNNEDGGNRKFILVECEDYADTITAERVRRVINGVPHAKDKSLREGLGGSFTYCTLGKPIEIEGMLTGEALPPYESLAVHLLYTTTGASVGASELEPKTDDGLFHGDEKIDYYMLYKPDLEYLLSNESMLNLERAERIHNASCQNGKKAIVYGPGKYMPQKMLTEMGITFCQLPHALYGR